MLYKVWNLTSKIEREFNWPSTNQVSIEQVEAAHDDKKSITMYQKTPTFFLHVHFQMLQFFAHKLFMIKWFDYPDRDIIAWKVIQMKNKTIL
jgi:hypothetical protein